MLRLPKRVGKHEKGAIPAFRIHKGEHYKIDETKCVEGSVLLEPPSIPDINTGEFEALSEKGNVLGVYVGHDHKNSYVGKVGNIDVGFTQSAGFNVYGNGKQRGVRCSSSTRTIRAIIRHIPRHMSSSATASSIRR